MVEFSIVRGSTRLVALSSVEIRVATAHSADLREGVVSVTEAGASRRAKAGVRRVRASSALGRAWRGKDSGSCAAKPTDGIFACAKSRPTGLAAGTGGCRAGSDLGGDPWPASRRETFRGLRLGGRAVRARGTGLVCKKDAARQRARPARMSTPSVRRGATRSRDSTPKGWPSLKKPAPRRT